MCVWVCVHIHACIYMCVYLCTHVYICVNNLTHTHELNTHGQMYRTLEAIDGCSKLIDACVFSSYGTCVFS